MKRLLHSAVILGMIIISGCGVSNQKKEIVAKINNFEITKDRFELEFKESVYGRQDTLQSRKEFLDNLIDRKLILQDAQAKGLDKEQGFLRMIERFWEQALLKIALDRKTAEIAGDRRVSGDNKSQAINAWVADLRKNAHIDVREELLKQ